MKRNIPFKMFTAGLFTFILALQCFMVQGALAQEAGTSAEEVRQAQEEAGAAQLGRPPVVPLGTGEELLLPHTPADVRIEEAFFETRLPMLTQLVVSITGAISFLFVVIGGIRLLTAYSSEEKIENGKKTVIYAFVGLVISLLSYALVSIISGIQITQAATLPEANPTLIAQSGGTNRNTESEDQTPGFRPPAEDVTYGGQSSPEVTGNLVPGRVVPENSEDSKTQYVANLKDPSWEEIIASAIRMLLNVAGSLTLIAMTTAGIFMLIAQGDEDKIRKAKEIILWSLIALAIIAASYGLVIGVTQLQFFQ